MLVLDSGGLTRLSARTKTALSRIRAFQAQELWPPVVPTMVLVESLHGDPRRGANTHRWVDDAHLLESVGKATARRAAELGRRARTGSAVDALVVAIAEPGGTVLTGDRAHIEALAGCSTDVVVELV